MFNLAEAMAKAQADREAVKKLREEGKKAPAPNPKK